MDSESSNNKLLHLEGLRGIAAVIVVFHHYALAFFPALIFGTEDQRHFNSKLEIILASGPLNVLYNGGFAVSVFFVLSGYVLSRNYHNTFHIKTIINGASKRYFRLMIPVVASSLISFLLLKFSMYYHVQVDSITHSKDWLSSCILPDGTWWEWIKTSFINVFINYDNRYNPVLWTMTYELLGSLMLFGFLIIQHFSGRKTLFYFLPVVLLIYFQEFHYASFFAGSLICKLHSEGKCKIDNGFLNYSLFIIGIYFASFPMASNNISQSFYGWMKIPGINNYEAYHLMGSIAIIISLCAESKMKKLLSSKLLVFIGKISFSFYLLHFLIIASLVSFMMLYFSNTLSYINSFLLSASTGLIATLLLSMLFYQFIDRKAGQFKLLP